MAAQRRVACLAGLEALGLNSATGPEVWRHQAVLWAAQQGIKQLQRGIVDSRKIVCLALGCTLPEKCARDVSFVCTLAEGAFNLSDGGLLRLPRVHPLQFSSTFVLIGLL